MADFWLKTGDLKPSLTAVLVDATGSAVDLTGAEVTFVMRLIDATSNTVENLGDITAPLTGEVTYEWEEGDTDIPGGYVSEFIVSFADGKSGTFPNQTYDRIAILERLGSPVGS